MSCKVLSTFVNTVICGIGFAYPKSRFLGLYIIVYTLICMDIQIGWQVPGQQDGRLADTHVYVYTCLIASMLTYLSYRAYIIYSIVYTIICMDIKKCWHVSGQQVSRRQVDM